MTEELKLPFRHSWKIIELGGGKQPLYHPNVDSRWEKEVDIVTDLNNPIPFEDSSYDGVFAKFVIEHLKPTRVTGFIDEIFRVLKPGGIAVIITANLLEQAKKLVEIEDWNEDLICMVFGGKPDHPGNYHHCGFSPAYAKKLFGRAGFYKVEVDPWPGADTDMVITGYKSKAMIR